MAALAMKRMARERKTLEGPNNDYVVLFKDDNLLKFDAYVFGPQDSLYMHKLVKLRFEIPHDYPLKPPKVKFIQHSGGRIHPNLYVEGKVCLSILGTWQGEPWAFAMTCETVLITIRSLLDNKPYLHEPHQRDNPAFNDYVRYNTWRWLLLDYLRNEQEPTFKAFLQSYMAEHGDVMISELQRQSMHDQNGRLLTTPYGRPGSTTNYPTLITDLCQRIDECKAAAALQNAVDPVGRNASDTPQMID